jgi:tetratricopeptide (TPR) repeat protein
MPGFGRGAVLPVVLVATMATAARAQKQCEIDENTPGQVARAVLQLQLAQSASKPEDAAPKLRDAVKFLSEVPPGRNPVGVNYEMGRALVLWMAQPNIGFTPKRGALGFTTEPEGTIDLVARIDSSFSVVEKSNPECAPLTAQYRQQKGWVDLINSAIELGNADKTDSAVAVAKRSLQLYRGAPYAYMVLGQAAAKQNQTKEAIGYYKQAIDIAKDTSLADTRRQLLLNLGQIAENAAEAATGADKTEYAKTAKAAYEELMKDPGTKYADYARSGQARASLITGDTAAFRASYQEMIANPGAFSYNALMQGAVSAARADQNADAVKLFEAAYKANPYHRDVLYNLARLHMLNNDYSKGMPLVKQLVTVDPGNPDNFQLYAIGWAAQQKEYITKQRRADSLAKVYGQKANAGRGGAAAQKAYIDSAAKMTPIIRAYADSAAKVVDSAVKYTDLTNKLPARVTFNEFTPTDAKTTLAGTVTNNSDAEKSYTLKIEFVDKTGNVVAKADVPVGPVKAHGSASFTATGTAPGIVAFRYAPLN